MKNFKAVVIGHKTEEEKAYTSNVDTKKKRYTELFNHLDKFISLDEMSSFEGRIYDEAIRRFTEKHQENFPTLRIEKVAELHDMSLHKIDAMISAFNSIDIEWDLEKNEPTETPDFVIRTQSEAENKTYKLLTNIVNSIEEAQAEGMNFYPSPMLSGFNGWLQYDFLTSRIVPNISRIQGTERNY
jgi:hypothetical protein